MAIKDTTSPAFDVSSNGEDPEGSHQAGEGVGDCAHGRTAQTEPREEALIGPQWLPSNSCRAKAVGGNSETCVGASCKKQVSVPCTGSLSTT